MVSRILLNSGDFLLLNNGDKILLNFQPDTPKTFTVDIILIASNTKTTTADIILKKTGSKITTFDVLLPGAKYISIDIIITNPRIIQKTVQIRKGVRSVVQLQ